MKTDVMKYETIFTIQQSVNSAKLVESRKKTLIIIWEPHTCRVPHLKSINCCYVYAIIYGMQRK